MKFLSLLLMMFLSLSIVAQTWQPVGNKGFNSREVDYNVMAVDHMGTPYVAFEDDDYANEVTVMKYDGTNWVYVGNPGISYRSTRDIKLKISSTGVPYIAYIDLTYNNKVTVKKFNGSSWETVGASGFIGGGNFSLAIDGSGTPYIAYADDEYPGKGSVQKFNGTDWVIVGNSGFSNGMAVGINITISNSGTPYVAYCDQLNSSKLTVKRLSGSTWQSYGYSGAPENVKEIELAFDNNDNLYAVYEKAISYTYKGDVVKYNGSTWESVGNAGFSAGDISHTSLAIDESGVPHVAFLNHDDPYKADVMKFNGTEWEIVGHKGISDGSAINLTLAFDKSDKLFLSYKDNIFANGYKVTVMEFIPAPPQITVQPENKTNICVGTNVQYSISTKEAKSWQWQVSIDGGLNYNDIADGGLYLNTKTESLSVNATEDINNYSYRCVVTNLGGNTISDSASLVLNPKIDISTQPVALTNACEGDETITLSVVATGTLTYQWYKDSELIIDAINNKLNIITAPDNSGSYYCEISDAWCSTQSSSAEVNINPATKITTQPTINTIACEGDADITLAVEASGTGTVLYQWYKGIDQIQDATESTLIINTDPNNTGIYSCKVSSDCGDEIQSDNAEIKVNPATSITKHPESLINACEGDVTIELFVEAIGTGNITYQWYTGNEMVQDATDATLLITTNPSNSGTYYCKVNSECGNEVSSNNSEVTINTATAIISQSGSLISACENDDDIILSVDAIGTGDITYKWYKGDDILTNETKSELSIVTDPINSGTYHCVVGSDCGTDVISNNIEVVIDANVSINTHPTEVTNVCENDESINLNVEASGGGTLTYQWYHNDNIIEGATEEQKNIITNPDNSGTYYCIVSNQCGSNAQSNNATLEINPITKIIKQPESYGICDGDEDVKISIEASGTNLTYQWYFKNEKINDEVTNELIILADIDNAGSYYCIVKGECGEEQSENSEITYNQETVIVEQPEAQKGIENGHEAKFSVEATGSNLTYQWRKDGVVLTDNSNISGSLTNELTIAAVSFNNEGTYGCVVSGECGVLECNQSVLSVQTGINNIDNTGVNVYPNPIRNDLNIEFTDKSSRTIKVYDLLGKVLIEKISNSKNEIIDMSMLEDGIYIINIQTGESIDSYKMIKE